MFDLKAIRKDFPMLNGKSMRGHNLVYLDNASTTFKPQCVIDAVSSYLTDFTANSHRGDYDLCFDLDNKIADVRKKVASFINAKENEIVFTYGTTSSISLLAFGYGLNHFKKDDEIILNEAEHASDSLPWFELAKRTGAKLVFANLDEDHKVTLESIKKAITSKTKLIAVAAVTNVLGSVAPVKDICKLAHEKGILVAVDGAQSVPHSKTDVKDLDCDFLSFSGHKMCGPTGVGVLYGKEKLLEEINPIFTGGGNNISFSKDGSFSYLKVPAKFESGTQNIEGILGLGACIDYLSSIGMENIRAHEIELKKYAISKLKQNKDLLIYNDNNDSGIVTFNVEGVFAQDVATYLNNKGIAVRSGLHCAKMLNPNLGSDATVRASFYFYTSKEEIDALAAALLTVKGGFLDVYFN